MMDDFSIRRASRRRSQFDGKPTRQSQTTGGRNATDRRAAENVAQIVRAALDPLTSNQNGQKKKEAAAVRIERASANANPTAVAVWPEGKL